MSCLPTLFPARRYGYEFGNRYGSYPDVTMFVTVFFILRFWRLILGEFLERILIKLGVFVGPVKLKNYERSLAAQNWFNEKRAVKRKDEGHLISQQHKVGTIVELWSNAIKTHPEVVEA